MYSVIVPAAGSGSRLGAEIPKAFVSLKVGEVSQTLLEWCIRPFCSDMQCENIIVVVPPENLDEATRLLERYPKISVVTGGATRQDSVRLGLHFLTHCLGGREHSVVLVHDAARCNVTKELINRVVAGVKEYGAVTAALPVVDAMLMANDSGEIVDELPRAGAWTVQTPQGFLLGDLHRSHEDAYALGVSALDDASLVRRHRPVYIVEGERMNLKVTYPDDLSMAARWKKGMCITSVQHIESSL